MDPPDKFEEKKSRRAGYAHQGRELKGGRTWWMLAAGEGPDVRRRTGEGQRRSTSRRRRRQERNGHEREARAAIYTGSKPGMGKEKVYFTPTSTDARGKQERRRISAPRRVARSGPAIPLPPAASCRPRRVVHGGFVVRLQEGPNGMQPACTSTTTSCLRAPASAVQCLDRGRCYCYQDDNRGVNVVHNRST